MKKKKIRIAVFFTAIAILTLVIVYFCEDLSGEGEQADVLFEITIATDEDAKETSSNSCSLEQLSTKTQEYEPDNTTEENSDKENETTSGVATCTMTTEEKEEEIVPVEETTQQTTTVEEVITTTAQQITETTNHQHNFVVEVKIIHHQEEGHYEQQLVSDGWKEEIYESYDKYCYSCGAIMDEWSFEQLMAHSAEHGAYGSFSVVVETIWHEPEYEDVWVVDRAAYDEEVIVRRCIECGYTE